MKKTDFQIKTINDKVNIKQNRLWTAFSFQNKKSLYDDFIAFYFIGKTLGYIGFTIPHNILSNSIRITFSDIVITLLGTILNLCLVYMSIYTDTSESESILFNLGNKIILLLGLAITAPEWEINIINRCRIWRILQILDAADKEMVELGAKINYRNQYRISINYTLTQITFLVGYIGAVIVYPWRENSEINVSKSAVLLYCYGIILVILVGFIIFIACIYSRLCCLNDCIILNFNLTILDATFVVPHNMASVVRTLGMIYHKINEAIDLINFCFSMQIMLCFGLFFGFSVFTVFGTYRLTNHYSKNELLYILENLIWNGIFFNIVVAIIVLGDWIICEGKRTAVLLHKALIHVDDLAVAENIIFVSQQIRHRLPVISCGLFDFDWTLFYSMAAAFTTYFVVLIQFDDTIKPND